MSDAGLQFGCCDVLNKDEVKSWIWFCYIENRYSKW